MTFKGANKLGIA